VARKGELLIGREYPDAVGVVARRGHEGRLRQVEGLSYRLHARPRDIGRVGEDREGIAAREGTVLDEYGHRNEFHPARA
jgi:hypothetical protein